MKFKLLNVLLFLAVPFCVSGMSKDTSCAVVLYSGAKYTMEAKFINFAVRKAYHKKIQILTQEGWQIIYRYREDNGISRYVCFKGLKNREYFVGIIGKTMVPIIFCVP